MNLKIDWADLSQEAAKDRREGSRVKLRYELEVCGRDSEGVAYKIHAYTNNISEKGCCFEVARTMFPGESISLRVLRKNRMGIADGTDPVPFRIMWVKQEGGLWIAGAMMILPEDPWNVSFPPRIVAAKSA